MIDYYDTLFADMEGTRQYYAFVKKHVKGTSLLEFACGTGDLLNLLSKDFEVRGIDLDDKMLNQCKNKYPNLIDKVSIGNFLNYQPHDKVDTLICVGDSLNYLLVSEDLIQFVENASQISDHIILDMHHPHRLIEFETPYFEEGATDAFDYVYTIEKNEDYLMHQINFLDGTFDAVTQWVFDVDDFRKRFEDKGYDVKVYTDFDIEDTQLMGEKLMMICSRGAR